MLSLAPSVEKFLDFFAPPSELSSSCEIRNVTPALPTTAGLTERYPLLGNDLALLFSVEDVFVIPELIDVEKFAAALSTALSAYPTFSGRLKHDMESGEWWIALENAPIPLLIEKKPSYPLLEDDWVVVSEGLRGFIEPVKIFDLWNSQQPMMTVKLSFYPESNRTAVGIMLSHILGDGFHASQFQTRLSDIYQGKTVSDLKFTVPTALPLPPSPQHHVGTGNDTLDPDPRTQNLTCKMNDVYDHLLENVKDTDSVTLRVTVGQLSRLKRRTVEELQRLGELEDGVHLSSQDCLIALVMSSINRFDPGHINHIMSLFNFRGVIDPAHWGGNAITMAVTKVLSPAEQISLSRIALAVRHSLNEARNPEIVSSKIAAAQRNVVRLTNEGVTRLITPTRGRGVVNGASGYDRHAPHFGHPGRTLFYTKFTANRYMRTFRSNPELKVMDWETILIDAREATIDLQFRVDQAIARSVVKAIQDELEK